MRSGAAAGGNEQCQTNKSLTNKSLTDCICYVYICVFVCVCTHAHITRTQVELCKTRAESDKLLHMELYELLKEAMTGSIPADQVGLALQDIKNKASLQIDHLGTAIVSDSFFFSPHSYIPTRHIQVYFYTLLCVRTLVVCIQIEEREERQAITCLLHSAAAHTHTHTTHT